MFEGQPENRAEALRRLEESGVVRRIPSGSLFLLSEHPELAERLRTHRSSKEFHEALARAAIAGQERMSVEDASAAPLDSDTYLEVPFISPEQPGADYWDRLGN